MPLRDSTRYACVADEENVSTGTEEVPESFTADAAIVTDPIHLEMTLARKGFVRFDVIVRGRAAHGSRPDLGVDPIAKAGHFLVAVEELSRRPAEAEPHPLLGSDTVQAELTAVPDQLTATVPDFSYRLQRGLHRAPFEADPDQPVVRTLLRHTRSVRPRTHARHPRRAVLDRMRSPPPGRTPLPCPLLGVDGGGAHVIVE